MPAHGRPRGRARPRQRGAPPHAPTARDQRIANRRTTDQSERLARAHGREEQRVLFETFGGEIRDAYAGLICCYCEREVEDGRFVRVKDGTGRLRCLRAGCREREERARAA